MDAHVASTLESRAESPDIPCSISWVTYRDTAIADTMMGLKITLNFLYQVPQRQIAMRHEIGYIRRGKKVNDD